MVVSLVVSLIVQISHNSAKPLKLLSPPQRSHTATPSSPPLPAAAAATAAGATTAAAGAATTVGAGDERDLSLSWLKDKQVYVFLEQDPVQSERFNKKTS